MRLSELIEEGKHTLRQDWTNVDIKGLSADSRAIRPGYLFAAIPGTATDGRRFIDGAIDAGASAILAPPDTRLNDKHTGIPLVIDSNPRRALARMAANFYEVQPETTVAVTGTNGKTSVAHFAEQLWTGLGKNAASLGTLGMSRKGKRAGGTLTTPDPVELHRLLADLSNDGIDSLALEASSHGLDQHRLDGVNIRAAAFTNLSRDHLDYHASEAAYRDAKLRLFRDLLADDGVAIANAETAEAELIEAIAGERNLEFITYGFKTGDIRLEDRELTAEGWTLRARAFGTSYSTRLNLPGDFQIANALAATALLHATGTSIGDALAGFETLAGVPGRMQLVGTTANAASVYIDYAHTPDALQTALQALRPHITNKLVVIFGCGGDRDTGKRPQMGTIACQLADHVVVTDDNPRSEDPQLIRSEILAACDDAEEIGDRREAIESTVSRLSSGDGLLIAGKGHETGQIVGDEVLPFDDYDVAHAALEGAR
ncbi:MAG: UDP-N-acetylmuramoyl-L-alanyl-D-glutamate--2,6-diaminopimelate ligase [Rhodospirillaceae bacterium]|nr:UDP-N-acetylmuramoyl-L-alanyl-D-glutamate--2,6-diaminopimelate ligase [Rhodospirillaceae bacterium]